MDLIKLFQQYMRVVVGNLGDFIIRKFKGMQIDDFLLEKQPMDKLVSAYLEIENSYDKTVKANNQRKETLLLNSILVALATKKATTKQLWNETKYSLEINSGNRDCLRRGAMLLIEVFKRNPQSLQAAAKDVILEIIGQSCEKAFITICGNEYIELIEHVTSKLSLSSDLQEALPPIITMAASNKLQVNTYRQETRLSLYKILLRLLDIQKEKSPLLQKCVRAGEGQKDPRNIGIVFELYLKVLQIFPAERLVQYRAAMFENIEAYYPVEFVGDEDDKEHRKVNFREISSLLDQCLCHPFFSELTWELLSSKTAAPPLAPFISTLLAYFRSLRRTPNPALNVRLASLLFRFSQEEFIDQEYEEHAPEDLSTVVQGLLDVIFCKEDGSFTIEGYVTVKKWLDLTLSKVTIGECHHSGTMMGLFRAIINRANTPRFAALIELVRSLSLKAILRTITDGQIIPKLGLAVVVVTEAGRVSDDVQQLIGLLVLKIGSLYSTVSDEVKLLLLKILMEVYKGAERNRAMVRKVNDGLILKDILSRAQIAFSSNPNPNQAYLVKAFIDFVATVHVHEIDQLLEHVTGLNFELESYLLGRLWENVENNAENHPVGSKIIGKFNQIVQLISKNEQGEYLVKGLRVISKPLLLKLILTANWQRSPQFRQPIFSILLALRKELQTLDTYRSYIKTQKVNSSLSNIISQFFLHNNQQGLTLSKEEQLWRALGNEQNSKVTFPLMAQIETYDVQSQFMENLILAYPSTFVQWSWEELKARQDSEIKSKRLGEILKWLPQPLLLRDRKEVLGLILSDGKCAPSLLKIAKHIQMDTIKSSGIIQYCLQYVHSLLEGDHPENTTERTTCILATLISVAERDEKGDLKQAILQSERILKELRQHRKRPVRQAVRRLLTLLQE